MNVIAVTHSNIIARGHSVPLFIIEKFFLKIGEKCICSNLNTEGHVCMMTLDSLLRLMTHTSQWYFASVITFHSYVNS